MSGWPLAHPEWLALVAAGTGLLVLALLAASVRGRLRALAFAGRSAGRGGLRVGRDVLLALALVLLALGLLGPRIGERVVWISTSGVDLVLLVDLSRSMDARDVPPSRLDAARRAARALLAGLESGDRVALAAYAGRGALLTPLTHDHVALAEMLSGLDTRLVRPGGSDLPAGLSAAIEAFEPASRRPRAVFVLSDGEVLEHLPEVSGLEATRADVRIHAAALGREAGATVPDHGVPLRDRAGGVVETRRRLTALERLTEETGGRLYAADEWGRFDVPAALAGLRAPVAGAREELVPRRVTAPVVLPFAAFAFALLLAEALLAAPAVSRARPVAALALASLALVAADAPEGDDANARARAWLRTGIEHAEAGRWSEAERRFQAAATTSSDAALAAIAHHDLAVAALERGDLEAATVQLFEAVANGAPLPDEDARRRALESRFNLEWLLVRTRPPPGADASGEPDVATPPREADAREAPAGDDPDEDAGDAEADALGATPAEPPPLSPEDRERWLGRVQDDPSRALSSAARAGGGEGRRRSEGPTW